jgi:hypothetical protein
MKIFTGETNLRAWILGSLKKYKSVRAINYKTKQNVDGCFFTDYFESFQ